MLQAKSFNEILRKFEFLVLNNLYLTPPYARMYLSVAVFINKRGKVPQFGFLLIFNILDLLD